MKQQFFLVTACAVLAAAAACSGGDADSASSTASSPAATSGGAGSNPTSPGHDPEDGPLLDVPAAPVAGGGSSGIDEGACAAEHHQATLRPLSLYILLDQSGSMTTDEDRWTPVTQALNAFVASPRSSGVEVGLGYFPYLAEEDDVKCEVERYSSPDVAIAALPDNASALADSITAHHFGQAQGEDENRSGTPTRPAHIGAVEYMKQWLEQHPDRAGAVVLATDGDPTGVCDDNDVSDVADAIAEAAALDPAVPTYVIGIGLLDNLAVMAEAGGTGHGLFSVDGTGQDTEGEFLAALEAIRGVSLPCDFALPVGLDTDPGLVNVEYQAEGGGQQTLFKVAEESACGTAGDDWYYDDPNAPARVVLCPATCSLVSERLNGSVDIALGCRTVLR